MPAPRTLELNAEQRDELEEAVRSHPLAYMRERAAALLRVADGWSGARAARESGLIPRQPDTIYGWLNRYEHEGFDGLYIREGRGRKPAFSP